MKLMLAVDLHDNAEPLTRAAAVWAERTRGKLSLLYVEELGESWATGVTDPSVLSLIEAERAGLRQRHRERLDELNELIPATHRAEPTIVHGSAWSAIAEASKEADLLIIGTHGRTGLAHFFMGSVAERVVRTANCPVLVLRPGAL